MTHSIGIKTLSALAIAVTLSACGKKDEAPAVASASTDCGKVTVANMTWQSAEVLAQIDNFILTHGYGCDVEVVPGDTMPTLTSMMERGQPDVAPEAWVNAVREPLEAALAEGKLHYGARALEDGGVEGWWIPKFLADANPDIKTIDDALARPELFPAPESRNRAAVHNCPAGWACQITTANAFKAWDAAAKGFDLVDTGSAAGLDGSIARANERQIGWLGYYWAPTSILGKYEMVKLDAGVPHDPVSFGACNAVTECANPTKNDWAKADVFTVMSDRFHQQGGPAVQYLTTRSWGNDTASGLLAWMSENQADGMVGARYFLQNNSDVWTQWVPAEVASQVRAAL